MLIALSTIAASYYSYALSPDHSLYRDALAENGATDYGNLWAETLIIEPFFLVLAKIIVKNDLPYYLLFLIFAAISVSLKINLITRTSRNIFASALIYFSYFFLIHDSTQIRASLAIGMLYWALLYLSDGKYLRFLVMVLISSAIFHVSSILFTPIIFFCRPKSYKVLIILVIVSVCFYLSKVGVFSIIDRIVSSLGSSTTLGLNKIAVYAETRMDDDTFNPLGLISIFSAIFAVLVLLQRKSMNDFEKLCLNCFLLSISISFLLFDFGALQIRLRAIYSFSIVFLAPFAIRSLINDIKLDCLVAYSLYTIFMMMSFEYFSFYKGLLIN